MKFWFSIPLLFYFFGTINAQIPEDKLKHLGAGVVIGGISGLAANQLFNGDRYWTWSAAIGGSLAAGVAKESYDTSRGGTWDNGDVVYTVLGGVVSGLVFELFVNKDGCRRRGRPCKYYSLQMNDLQEIVTSKPLLIIHITETSSGNLTATIQATSILTTMQYPRK